MTITKVSNSMLSSAPISILDYGAHSTTEAGYASFDSTAAIQGAMAYASSIGGAIVKVPNGRFLISELTFDGLSFVVLEGECPGFNYGNPQSNSILYATTGVWAVRLPFGSSYCGLRNLAINGSSTRAGAFPYTITTLGVEYGVLIETNTTLMQQVTVYAFQYGCTIANAGNTNVFENCGFIWNTRAGFVCTNGSAAAYALYHPNLTPPATMYGTTVFTMRNCNLRRNGWGLVLRDGVPIAYNVLCESNLFGGLLEWIGASDIGVGGNWYASYFEGNWTGFNPALNWVSAAVTGNTILLNSAGVYISLADNANTALSSFGYQITMGGETAGVSSVCPTYQNFYQFACVSEPGQKAMFLRSSYKINFHQCSATHQNPADIPNSVKLGEGAYLATGSGFYDWNGSLPTVLSNNGFSVVTDLSVPSTDAGLTMTRGHYRGLAGNVTQFGSDEPVTISGNPTLTDTQTSVIATGGNSYYLPDAPTNIGKWIHMKVIAASAVESRDSNVVPIIGGAAGTAILPATAGAWCSMQSDGVYWIIMAQG